ncbi:DUF599 domain-containing protein [Comamonas guangdongensis]|uniref:DUF599 domain-containing protein n=1 Tax=Comamonas guangdongensis TaxID=510515 RepID=A0ABV3ZQN8_9BURK
MFDAWFAAWVTLVIVAAYELWLLLAQRRWPRRLARTVHAALREDWFASVSQHRGSEILAVQTLRNSLMSATMTASTAMLALMGALTLTASSLHASFGAADAAWPGFTPRLAMEIVMLGLLFASLIACTMAVRYYNHAGFVGGMPVESAARRAWAAAGTAYVRKAGLLYSWGLRQLLLVVPAVAFILHPLAGVGTALAAVIALAQFDRFQAVDETAGV